MHTAYTTTQWLHCLFVFPLPNVTQQHPPSTRSQTSYQEFSGCLSGSGSWSKLMARQQLSLQCETYPPIYHTDCRHDVVAGECTATHPIYVSTFFISSLLPPDPGLFLSLLSSFILSPTHPSVTSWLPFLVYPPNTSFHLFVSLFLSYWIPILHMMKKNDKGIMDSETDGTCYLLKTCEEVKASPLSAAGYNWPQLAEEVTGGERSVWRGCEVKQQCVQCRQVNVTCVHRHWGLLSFLACCWFLLLHCGPHWKYKHTHVWLFRFMWLPRYLQNKK